MTHEEATAKANEIIRNYQTEIPEGDDDYSCNECKVDSFLCPHLYERLKRHIVEGLMKVESSVTTQDLSL